MQHLGSDLAQEQRAGDMRGSARRPRAVLERGGVGLDAVDERGKVGRGIALGHAQHHRHFVHHRHSAQTSTDIHRQRVEQCDVVDQLR